MEKPAGTQRAESHGASQESASAQLRSGEPAVEPYEEGQYCHHTYGNSAYPDLGQKLLSQDGFIGRTWFFLHQLFAVRFEPQRDGRQTVRQQVYEQQMDRRERHRQRAYRREQHCQYGAEVTGKQELYRMLYVLIDIPSVFHGFHDSGKVVVRQHHGSRVLRDLASRYAHSHSDISLFESRCVIDAVSRHCHDIALVLPCSDDPYLVLRRNSGVHGNTLHVILKLLVVHTVYGRAFASFRFILQYTYLFRYGSSRYLMVARYHHRLYPGADTFSHRSHRFLSRRIHH